MSFSAMCIAAMETYVVFTSRLRGNERLEHEAPLSFDNLRFDGCSSIVLSYNIYLTRQIVSPAETPQEDRVRNHSRLRGNNS